MIEYLLNDIREILSSSRLIASNLISLLATVLLICSCLSETKEKMFLFQAVQCGMRAVSQLVLGMYGGLVTLGLGIIRDVGNAYDKMNRKKILLLSALIGVVGVAVNVIGRVDWFGYLPIASAVTFSIGTTIFKTPNMLRVNLMFNLTFWVVYSVLTKDYIFAITSAITLLVDLVAFLVILVQEHRAKQGIVIGGKNK